MASKYAETLKISTYRPPRSATKADMEKKFGGKLKTMKVLGKIGSGTKIHRILIEALKTPDGLLIWSANSWCGSQKWSNYRRSPIHVFASDNLALVDCDKCLGRRVKGGKTPPPTTKRPKVDPLSRPRSYYFDFKVDMEHDRSRKGEPRREDARGMTEAEAWAKVKRRNDRSGYYSKVYAPELVVIYAWNGKPLWRKSSGKPRPKELK